MIGSHYSPRRRCRCCQQNRLNKYIAQGRSHYDSWGSQRSRSRSAAMRTCCLAESLRRFSFLRLLDDQKPKTCVGRRDAETGGPSGSVCVCVYSKSRGSLPIAPNTKRKPAGGLLGNPSAQTGRAGEGLPYRNTRKRGTGLQTHTCTRAHIQMSFPSEPGSENPEHS